MPKMKSSKSGWLIQTYHDEKEAEEAAHKMEDDVINVPAFFRRKKM